MTTLADLEAMEREDLARLWKDLIGGPVPSGMSQQMQRRFLAFELQAKVEGGLPAAIRARLDRIAAGEERKASPSLQHGARLLREWNGTTHVVDVLPDGFLWNGTPNRSLSAIARSPPSLAPSPGHAGRGRGSSGWSARRTVPAPKSGRLRRQSG